MYMALHCFQLCSENKNTTTCVDNVPLILLPQNQKRNVEKLHREFSGL